MTDKYLISFIKGKQAVVLPINPATLPVERQTKATEYDIIALGQVIVPHSPTLRAVKISGLFPAQIISGVFAPEYWHEPSYYIDFFNKAQEEKAPLLYVPARFNGNTPIFLGESSSFKCIVSSFTYEEKGGEVGDFYYTLAIKEYRDFAPIVREIQEIKVNNVEKKVVLAEPSRSTDEEIVVGSACIANGKYYYTSYGDTPFGTTSGRKVIVKRIVDKKRSKPYLLTTEQGGLLGWCSAEILKKVT